MNGELKEWSETALSIMKESEKSNKEEHKQIIDKISKLCGSLKRTQIMMLLFIVITLSIIIWEIFEYAGK